MRIRLQKKENNNIEMFRTLHTTILLYIYTRNVW